MPLLRFAENVRGASRGLVHRGREPDESPGWPFQITATSTAMRASLQAGMRPRVSRLSMIARKQLPWFAQSFRDIRVGVRRGKWREENAREEEGLESGRWTSARCKQTDEMIMMDLAPTL